MLNQMPKGLFLKMTEFLDIYDEKNLKQTCNALNSWLKPIVIRPTASLVKSCYAFSGGFMACRETDTIIYLNQGQGGLVPAKIWQIPNERVTCTTASGQHLIIGTPSGQIYLTQPHKTIGGIRALKTVHDKMITGLCLLPNNILITASGESLCAWLYPEMKELSSVKIEGEIVELICNGENKFLIKQNNELTQWEYQTDTQFLSKGNIIYNNHEHWLEKNISQVLNTDDSLCVSAYPYLHFFFNSQPKSRVWAYAETLCKLPDNKYLALTRRGSDKKEGTYLQIFSATDAALLKSEPIAKFTEDQMLIATGNQVAILQDGIVSFLDF